MKDVKTCLSTPTVITGEIQNEVLTRFRSIDKNDSYYLNKTEKAQNELESFAYTRNDGTALARGFSEDIETTFNKEREAGLEYQNDAMFERSTTEEYFRLSATPHTHLPTKLLELRPLDREDLFAKMYVRFVTESILYNIALGNADDVLKIEYGEISASLSIKDLLILFLYCEAQLHGYFTKTDNSGTVYRDVKIPTSVALCVPYKKRFPPISDYYKWHNIPCYSPYVLNIVPEEITLYSGKKKEIVDSTGEYTETAILPKEAEGVYRLTNPEDPKSKWLWMHDNGSSISYDMEKGGVGRWVFFIASGSEGITTYCTTSIPYWNWLCWHPDLVYADYTGKDISVSDAELKVTKFHYVMDDRMPNYETYAYLDNDYPDEDLVHLIDKQATYLVDMYQEYLLSGLSRQHAAFLQVLDERTFRGIVSLNLSPYETFKEHIENSNDLKELLRGFDFLSEETKQEEYAYLADTVIKLLYPIDSPYLTDSTLQLGGKLSRIKDLVIDLCSYNVAWLSDGNAFGNTILDCFGQNTIDIVQSVYGMEDISRITETDVNLVFRMGMVDKWCYDAIYDKQYIWNTDNTVYFMVYLIKQMHLNIKDSTIEKAVSRYKKHREDGSNYNPPTNKLSLDVMDRIYEQAIALGYDPFKEFTPPVLQSIPVEHCCIDHQYVINSSVDYVMRTVIAPIEYGDNGARVGHVLKTVLNLAESDYVRPLVFPTKPSEILNCIDDIINEIIENRDNYPNVHYFKDIITEYGKDKVRLFLSMLYHLKFRDATIASLLKGDYDPVSYIYKQPTQGTRVVTKPNLIKK